MPWVRFIENYDERVTSRAFRKRNRGTRRMVRRKVAEDAIRRGAAELIEHPLDLKSTKSGKVVRR